MRSEEKKSHKTSSGQKGFYEKIGLAKPADCLPLLAILYTR